MGKTYVEEYLMTLQTLPGMATTAAIAPPFYNPHFWRPIILSANKTVPAAFLWYLWRVSWRFERRSRKAVSLTVSGQKQYNDSVYAQAELSPGPLVCGLFSVACGNEGTEEENEAPDASQGGALLKNGEKKRADFTDLKT